MDNNIDFSIIDFATNETKKLIIAVNGALDYCKSEGIEIPLDIQIKAWQVGAMKASGDITAINAAYHDAITQSLLTYLEGGSVSGPKNQLKKAMVEAFGGAWDLGWEGDPPTGDALDWFNARTTQEISYIDGLFVQAKEARGQEGLDALGFATQKADAYTQTIASIFNAAKIWAQKNQMLTWSLGNTEQHCSTCASLDGKSHRASWYISHDYVPRKPGAAMDCGGYNCDCSLTDKDGNEITI